MFRVFDTPNPNALRGHVEKKKSSDFKTRGKRERAKEKSLAVRSRSRKHTDIHTERESGREGNVKVGLTEREREKESVLVF